jgi:hypothetical protein
MKIRLLGSADLVRAWSRELERAYGIKGKEYPSRYGGNEIRAYFDLDDRQAAAIVGLPQDGAPAPTPAPATKAAATPRTAAAKRPAQLPRKKP